MPVNVPCLRPRCDLSLKVRNQTGGIAIAAVGAISQMLKQLLQEEQITEGQLLVLAGRRHVASGALERGEDLLRGAFEIQIEIGREHGRPPAGDRGSDPSCVLIRQRGMWLGSAHRGYNSSNHSILAATPVASPSNSMKSTTDFRELGIRLRP